MKKVTIILISIILIIPNLIFLGCGNEDKFAATDKERIENLKLPEEKENLVGIELYFDASKDGKTEKIGKEERLIDKEELLGELIVQELIKGPSVKSELRPILPNETRLLSFSIKDGIAIINFSKEAKINMPEIKEKACLIGISRSLTQLPSVEKVQILVENKNVDSLGGNYDISSPFSRDEIHRLKK